jgi:hypothetical protein
MIGIISRIMDDPNENNLRLRLQEFFDLRYVTQIDFAPTKLIAYGSVALVAGIVATAIAAYIFKV